MPEQQFEIIIFYRPTPSKDAHLIDLTARHHDDICIAVGNHKAIDAAFTQFASLCWRESKQRKLTPPEEEE